MPMKNIFSFCNQKGGVGKTTTTVNIAVLMANAGYKVLVIDMDSQANSTSGLGEEKPGIESTSYQLFVDNSNFEGIVKQTNFENLFLIPANADLSGAELELYEQQRREYILKKSIETFRNKYDFVFIDCPPSLGLVTLNCLAASNYIIIPLQSEYYALEGLGQLLHTFQLVKKNLNPNLEIGGVLMTMADLRTNLTQQVIEEVKNYFHEKVFESIIPRSVKISEAPSFGKPAVIYDPHNKGSQAYFLVGKEFEKRFKGDELNSIQNTSEKLEQIASEASEISPEPIIQSPPPASEAEQTPIQPQGGQS